MKQNKKRWIATLLTVAIMAGLLSGCATTPEVTPNTAQLAGAFSMAETVEIADMELVPLTDTAPTSSTILTPIASGTTVYGNTKAEIDGSNMQEGYVMMRYLETTTSPIKVVVTGPTGAIYYYNLAGDGTYEVFPLSDGNGTYRFQICKNVSGTSYAVVYSTAVTVTLTDEFAPFLYPNQYVNYAAGSTTVIRATLLTMGQTTQLGKIEAVYNFVVDNLTYDTVRAATVQSGYLPNLDAVLAEGKGICFDYAALMTAMLRSQGIPCKLVVGYAGTEYHAWISTYSETDGWMDGAIYFDGTSWKLMDPTFASGGNSSESIMEYINNGANYTVKYLY